MREDGLWNDWFEEIKGESSLDLLLLAAAKRRRKRMVRYGTMGAFALASLGLICWQMWPKEPSPGTPPIANGNTPPLPKRNYPLLPKFPEAGVPAGPPEESVPVRPIPNTNGLAVKPGTPEENKAHVSLSILSDDELFDLLKGQSVAIVGEKGHRRVVFLEPVSTRSQPAKSKKE
jgi:hypothetical protein